MHAPNRHTTGFTLIEILVATAIVAILAAMAIPMYHGHTVRAKVSECIGLASPPKLAVSEALSSGRGINYEFTPTRYCADIRIANDGTIVMNTRNTGAATEPVLQFVPTLGGGNDGNLSWDCQLVAGKPPHVPSSCRSSGTMADLASDADGMLAYADTGSSGAGATTASGSSGAGGSASGSGSSDSSSSGNGSSGSGSSGSDSSGSDSSGSGSSGSGSSDSGSSGNSSSGSGSSGSGSSGSGSSGSGSSGSGTSDSGSSGSASSDGSAAAATEDEECPYVKPNGKRDNRKCRDWEPGE